MRGRAIVLTGLLWVSGLGHVVAAEPQGSVYCVPADVTVTIGPSEATGAAEWQVATERDDEGWVLDAGAWRVSGETQEGVLPGLCAIVVRTSGAWAAPDPITTIVCGGAELSFEVSLSEVNVYDTVDLLPPQTVRAGEVLGIYVKEGIAAVDPAGVGSLDGARYTYRPAPGERGQLVLTFQSPTGTRKNVVVDVLPILSPEHSVIAYRGTRPEPDQDAYCNDTVAWTAGVHFNYEIQSVRDAAISGPRIVFENGTKAFEEFAYTENQQGNENLRSLEVYADEVVIRERVHLPGTNVVIYARELSFEGSDARLITTPIEKTTPPNTNPSPIPGPGGSKYNEDGAFGLAAGSVTLYVGAIHAPEESIRFLLVGGKGQDGEPGDDGAPLSDPPRQICDTLWFDGFDLAWRGRVVRVRWIDDSVFCDINGRTVYGVTSDAWTDADRCPRSGHDAVGDGAPGRGGNGAALSAPFDLTSIADVRAGVTGAATVHRSGSPGDWPSASLRTHRYLNDKFLDCAWGGWHVQECGNRDGIHAPPLDPVGPVPDGGSVVDDLSPLSWLHPVTIRTTLQYAKDLYLNGYSGAVRMLLQPYALGLDEYLDPDHPAPPAADEIRELTQLRGEIDTMLHRIDNHLDYFGYPAGWVPMLSFEVQKQLFEDEVSAAAGILYVAYYLNRAGNEVTQKAVALDRLRTELSAERDKLEESLTDALNDIQGLKSQATVLDAEIRFLGEELRRREEMLEHTARRYAAMKKAFRVLGNVLPMIPIGQPALGVIGSGLTAASKFNEQSALDSAIEGTNLASQFLGSEIGRSMENFQGISDPVSAAVGIALELRQKELEAFNAAAVSVNSVLKEVKTWDTDVQREIQILAAEDPLHKDLVRQVEILNTRKKEFAEEMAIVIQKSKRIMDGINHNRLAIASLTRDLGENLDKIDQEAFRYVKEMEQRSRDRLLKYQYYLIKAYHYRMLTQYGNPDAFQLGKIHEHFQTEFSQHVGDDDPFLPADVERNLAVLYEDALRQVTHDIVEKLNANYPERSETLYLQFTLDPGDPKRPLLEQLNAEDGPYPHDPLRLNLFEDGGVFDQLQENIRIYNLTVKEVEAHPRDGGRTADVKIYIRHSGESLLASRGETYKFLHYRTVEQAPIEWSARYRSLDQSVSPTQFSEASGSLLRSLLEGESGQAADDILLYSRPAAWADLVVTKETTDPEVEMLIDRLVLEVQVDFYGKEQQVELDVRAATDAGETLLAPLVLLDRADENGRTDGRGRFRRVFSSDAQGSMLELSAPIYYGPYRFDHWEGRSITEPGRLDQVLRLALGVSAYRAVYRVAGDGAIFRRGDSNDNGEIELTDAVVTLAWLYQSGAEPPCLAAANVNGDEQIDVTDAVNLLGHLYLGEPPPVAPFPGCGIGELATDEQLGCKTPHAHCP